MKQTAVAWLLQELKKSTNYRGLQNIGITHQELFEQAVIMEADQMGWINKPSQTEISDEDIEKEASNRHYGTNFKKVFASGAKWYREQLKKKQ